MGYRLDKGGHVDRSQPIHFRWNGRKLPAFAGDTIASALLANNVAIAGRGMKLHRPRGVFAIGPEEPNALVTLGRGATAEPSARATMIPVRDGLEVRAQNAWPSVGFDLGRMLDRTAGLWHAAFYHKTFKWPSWDFWEWWIRRTAGIATPPREPDPARYDAVHAHCDLLIVGAGPAGLLAAQVASRSGLTVILAEQDFECGGRLLATNTLIDDAPVTVWFASLLGELAASRSVKLLTSTTCFGLYDHGMAGLLQRLDLGNEPGPVRQRYWRVHAKQTLLATGAIEQPLVFVHNDLPGIMLAGAARQYANRYGVAAGRKIVLATNNDSAYLAALDLVAAGAPVRLVLDCRAEAPADLAKWLRAQGVEVRAGSGVAKALGRRRLDRIVLVDGESVSCDALGVSGGWQPAVHLWSHARAPIAFDEDRRSFLPQDSRPPLQAIGSLNGCTSLDASFVEAIAAVHRALAHAGWTDELMVARPIVQEAPLTASAGVPPRIASDAGRQWLDFLHDVTVADAEIALAEGYEHIEHLKRYTTCGMAADQGKTSGLNALLTVAEMTAKSPNEVGTTTFRPPYTPVTLGALAGRQLGPRYAPKRLLPAHAEHEALGAHWWEAGGWMRPACYPRKGESPAQAVQREAAAVRAGVGVFDASPLGKIEVTGPDAAKFLDRFYVNNVAKLEDGRVRYALMLNEGGAIIDDGTVARLGREHFVVTTTSGGASRIAAWLEEWRQCEWPELEVFVTPVTTQWATFAVAGPRARQLLARFRTDIAFDWRSMPHMSLREGRFAGVHARLYRVSFSGELGYEINVPARCGAALWSELLKAGTDFGVTPYGIETVLLLRLEKGYLHVGVDTDGTTAPADVGWGAVAAKRKSDFIGKRSLSRPDNQRADRLQLVGLTDAEAAVLVPGAHLRLPGTNEGSDGWVTSASHSPALGKTIALALLRGGRDRVGETLTVHDLDRTSVATIVSPTFLDPEGKRLHA
ncbi:MAG TPA: sarcosine oxidase subunit alpha family protein [Steroidobacteraceae bacterium]|nr:sarcosine oxidase subunit alpha family protein [Steroidobacteraceae bacterium]